MSKFDEIDEFLAINGILDVAQGSDHPRAYEVAGQLIKSVGDTTDK